MKRVILASLLLLSLAATSQDIYRDSIQRYIARYVNEHEVVLGEDRKQLSFYPIEKAYCVTANFTPVRDSKWFSMPTSGSIRKVFRVYGTLEFRVHDTLLHLNIYQSQDLMQVQEYKEHLFLPFTDLSTGETSYGGGRYIDMSMSDIKNNKLVIDFNKAYNPYCAYVTGKYNCPIPPKENDLPVLITAGEKQFGKKH